MWTRGHLRRYHTPPVPHVWRDTRKGALQGSGAIPFSPPPLIPAMDPSDKRTWTRTVRFT